MIKVSREWATPLAIGVFALMGITGGLMFFHLDSNLQKTVHEWAGWVMVAAVLAHATANWLGFKRYFKVAGRGALLMGVCALVLLGSFVSLPGSRNSPPPPILAMRALTGAPLHLVAPLAGKSVAEAEQVLAQAGFAAVDSSATLEQIAAGDREKMAKAMAALFPSPARD